MTTLYNWGCFLSPLSPPSIRLCLNCEDKERKLWHEAEGLAARLELLVPEVDRFDVELEFPFLIYSVY